MTYRTNRKPTCPECFAPIKGRQGAPRICTNCGLELPPKPQPCRNTAFQHASLKGRAAKYQAIRHPEHQPQNTA
jgi:hypothetical protein